MKKIAVLKLTDRAWNEWRESLLRKANLMGVEYEEKPKMVPYCGTPFWFDPFCELDVFVGRELSKRPDIELVEIREVSEESKFSTVVETDEKFEADFKYGEVYLCKHCGWPYATPHGRDMHEKRFCKRK